MFHRHKDEASRTHQIGSLLEIVNDSPTRVKPNTDPDFQFRHVSHLEGSDTVKDVKTHVGHFSRVTGAVPVGDPRSHHVGVSDRLHLNGSGTKG